MTSVDISSFILITTADIPWFSSRLNSLQQTLVDLLIQNQTDLILSSNSFLTEVMHGPCFQNQLSKKIKWKYVWICLIYVPKYLKKQDQ